MSCKLLEALCACYWCVYGNDLSLKKLNHNLDNHSVPGNAHTHYVSLEPPLKQMFYDTDHTAAEALAGVPQMHSHNCAGISCLCCDCRECDPDTCLCRRTLCCSQHTTIHHPKSHYANSLAFLPTFPSSETEPSCLP